MSETHQERTEFLKKWAADQRVVFEWDGEIGFGRPCVGMIVANHYVDLGPTITKRNEWDDADGVHHDVGTYEDTEYCEETWPPDGVEDAYHKHDCLAVLKHGPEPVATYEAVRQLHTWVRHLEKNHVVVKETTRKPDSALDAIFHGLTRHYLVVNATAAELLREHGFEL